MSKLKIILLIAVILCLVLVSLFLVKYNEDACDTYNIKYNHDKDGEDFLKSFKKCF